LPNVPLVEIAPMTGKQDVAPAFGAQTVVLDIGLADRVRGGQVPSVEVSRIIAQFFAGAVAGALSALIVSPAARSPLLAEHQSGPCPRQ